MFDRWRRGDWAPHRGGGGETTRGRRKRSPILEPLEGRDLMALLAFQNSSGFGAQVIENNGTPSAGKIMIIKTDPNSNGYGERVIENNGKSSTDKFMIIKTELNPKPVSGGVHNFDDFYSVTFNEHSNLVNGVNNSSVVADLKLRARNNGTTTPAVKIADAAGTTRGNPNDYGTPITVTIERDPESSEFVGENVQVTLGYSYTETRAGNNVGKGAITSSYRLIVKPPKSGQGTGVSLDGENQYEPQLPPPGTHPPVNEYFKAKIGDTLQLFAGITLNGTLYPGSVNSELQINLSVSDQH